MKFLKALIPIVVFGGCVCGDIYLAHFLFGKLPDTNWIFWAQLGIVVGIIWLTGGFILALTALTGIITYHKDLE